MKSQFMPNPKQLTSTPSGTSRPASFKTLNPSEGRAEVRTWEATSKAAAMLPAALQELFVSVFLGLWVYGDLEKAGFRTECPGGG